MSSAELHLKRSVISSRWCKRN